MEKKRKGGKGGLFPEWRKKRKREGKGSPT